MADRRFEHLRSDVEEDSDCLDGAAAPRYHPVGMDQVDGAPLHYRPLGKDVYLEGQAECFDSGISSGFVSSDFYSSGLQSVREQLERTSISSPREPPVDNENSQQAAPTQIDEVESFDEAYSSGLQCQDHTEYVPPQEDTTDKSNINANFRRRIEEYYTPDENGDTDLHLAIIEKSPDALDLIKLAPYCDLLDIQNDLGQTPLLLATILRIPEVIFHLRIRGAAQDLRDRDGNTALHRACRDGSLECVRALLETPPTTFCEQYPLPQRSRMPAVDINLKNYEGYTCLHLAAASSHIPVISYLYEQGININIRDGCSGRTILHHAIEMQMAELVLYLLKRCRADVHAQTFSGRMPIEAAWDRPDEQIKGYLLAHGAAQSVVDFPDSEDEASDSEEDMIWQSPSS